jgi:hypothetical protein
LICSATFFSKFERTLTEYQRFAMAPSTFCLQGRLRPVFPGTKNSAHPESMRAGCPLVGAGLALGRPNVQEANRQPARGQAPMISMQPGADQPDRPG